MAQMESAVINTESSVSVTRDADIHSPEAWTADLLAAGWVESRFTVWVSPCGAVFRGPYGAWCALQRQLTDRKAPAIELHGVTCTKRTHTQGQGGYLHGQEDDGPYDVDGVTYCGRCHEALAGDPRPGGEENR